MPDQQKTIFEVISPETGLAIYNINKLNNDWEFPNPTGLGLKGNVNLGIVDAQTEWLGATPSNHGYAGDIPMKTRHGNVVMSFDLWALADTDFDELFGYVRELNRYLNQDGRLKFQPDGMSYPIYINYFRSPLTALFNGQDRTLHECVELLLSTKGLPVDIVRHPYYELDKLTEYVETTVGNGGSNRTVILDNPGNVSSLVKFTVRPEEAESQVVELKVGRRSFGNLTLFESVHAFQVENADTLYNGTTVVADADATGNSVAKTEFAGVSGLARRWRNKINTPPGEASVLQGRFRCFFVMRVSNAGRYRVQMRWSEGDGDPCERLGTREEVELDFSDIEYYNFVEIDMGVIELRRGGDLTIEGWAARDPIDDDDDSSVGDVRWDMCWLMPLDELVTTVAVPGHARGGSNVTRYLGRELKDHGGTTAEEQDSVVLNAENDWAATPAAQLDAGRHKVTVRVNIRNKKRKRQLIGYLKVVGAAGTAAEDDGDGPVKIPLRTGRKLWTKRRKSITFNVGPGGLGTATPYRFMVELTNDPTDSEAKIVVEHLTHRFHRYSTPTAPLVIDGESRQARLYQGDDPVTNLSLKGGFIYAVPGEQLYVLSLGDLPRHGYDDIDDRDSLSKIKPNRTATVTVDLIPRIMA